MIIDKYCLVKLNKKNINHFKLKGYDVSNNELLINIEDLTPGSHNIIAVRCDICNSDRSIMWKEYYRSYKNGGIYCCSSKCSQSKNKKTNIERYGVDNPTKNKDIYEKIRRTISDRFGDEVIFKTDFFKNKKNNYYRQYNNEDFLNKRINELYKIGINMLSVDHNNNYIIKCEKGHTYSINNDVLYKRNKVYNVEVCTVCNKIDNSSYIESELYDFVKSIYDGVVLNNVRDIIKPYEIDIFIPDLRIGIEFNGIFWHSDKFKDKLYHKKKYDKSIESGISLIQIWEDDWLYRKDIVKSIIRNKLRVTTNRLFARNCKIVTYNDNKITKKFLDDNHIQGNCRSNIKIGLLYNNELVSLMTFSKNRYGVGKITNDDYELTRFAVKKNYSIPGSASKLLNFFIKNYNFNTLISFSDCDISNGDLYYKIGFNFNSWVKPTYYYIIDNKREHRFKWRKSNLLKMNLILDNETEFECMSRLCINKVYNSGHKKFIINSIN